MDSVMTENSILVKLTELESQDFEALEELLQTGSDVEWIEALEFNEFSLLKSTLQSILLYIGARNVGEEILPLCRCFGHASNIHPTVWKRYASVNGEDDILNATGVLVSLAEAVSSKYRATEYEEESLKIYLLVLFQFYSMELPGLATKVQNERMSVPEVTFIRDVFIQTTRRLLLCTHSLREELYFDALKVVTAMNNQFPSLATLKDMKVSKSALQGKPNELSRFILSMQADEGIQLNITEALLHLLNDCGYPRQNLPETIMYIRMFCDLYAIDSSRCYFYGNDSKVLLDIILRELNNISDEDYLVKHKYLVLLGRMFGTEYFELRYRVEELKEILTSITEHSAKVLLRQKAVQLLTLITNGGDFSRCL